MLRNKSLAPDFQLPDADGNMVSLADVHQGRPLAILFFRGEFCPTARRDLQTYANVYDRVQALGAELIGISADTSENHQVLRDDLWIPFPLLSDAKFDVSTAYGVYKSDDVGEGPEPHGEPALFVIDADRRIAYSQIMTGPKGIASPSEIAMILLYMAMNEGRY
jgi:peroxiredoxin Q/BCP